MIEKKVIIPIALVLILFVEPYMAAGIGLGVSAPNIREQYIQPDSVILRTMLISTDSTHTINVLIDTDGIPKSWISSDDHVQVSKGNSKSITVRMHIPEDALPGRYSGKIYFKGELEQSNGKITIIPGVIGDLYLQVLGKDEVICSVVNQEILTAGSIPELRIRMRNHMDQELGVSLTTQVKNTHNQLTDSMDEVRLPAHNEFLYKKKLIDIKKPGTYTVSLHIPTCRYQEETSYIYTPSTQLDRRGEFISLNIPRTSSVDSAIPVSGIFRNHDDRPVYAMLVGFIQGANLSIPFFSDEIVVQPGTEHNFSVFVQVNATGQYTVEAKILFNDKETVEFGSAITIVQTGRMNSTSARMPALYISSIVILIVISATMLILKRKLNKYVKTKDDKKKNKIKP